MSPAFQFIGVDIGYRGLTVLHAVGIEIPRGELAVVVGASGAGKSTFLRCAAGLIDPLVGQLVANVQRIGWVQQTDALDQLHPVTVEEVIGGACRYRGKGLRRACAAALEAVGLVGFERRPFADLSGGQRQRVLIARAIGAGVDCLVLDEPTSALDEDSSIAVRDAIAAELARGTTVLWGTHQPALLEGLAALTITASNGRVSTEPGEALAMRSQT